MNEATARLAYEESLRQLEVQREAVDGLRTRSGTLLAAAALVTTFLGGQALARSGDISSYAWSGIGLFVAACVCSILVLFPWNFSWGEKTNSLVSEYVDDDEMTGKQMLRDLALKHRTSRENNEGRLTVLQWLVRAGGIALAFEVVAWLIEIGTNQ